MRLRNTTGHYGLISVLLHWLSALLVIGLFASGWYMVRLGYYDDLYHTLPHLHKSIGVILLILLILRLLWRAFSAPPEALSSHSRWEKTLATAAKHLLLLLMALVISAGYLISTANGRGIDVFDWFTLPALISGLPDQADRAGLAHEYLAYALIALAALHALAALKHHFIDKDNTLVRMLGKAQRRASSSGHTTSHS